MTFKYFVFLSVCLLAGRAANSQHSNNTIQINIQKLLNARPVTTVTDGKLQTWVTGIDGGGKGDGYLTANAAKLNGNHDAHALPDNPLIPANSFHPTICFIIKTVTTVTKAEMLPVLIVLASMFLVKNIRVCT